MSHKYLVNFLIVALLGSQAAFAQGQAPVSNPSEVIVKGRKVSHSWRQGRIVVPTSELSSLLNIPSDSRDTDLLQALETKGGYTWTTVNGRFEARLDPTRYSVAPAPSSRAQSRVQAGRSQAEPHSAGQLGYEVKRFTADTGYVRAFILVTNNGPGVSDPSQMICQFQDGFGQTYAVDKRPVAAMEAGESQTFEIFSMVEAKDTSITPTADNVAVNFLSLTNPNANPTTRKEVRQQQKRAKTKRGLDFNSGYGNINRTQTLNNRRP